MVYIGQHGCLGEGHCSCIYWRCNMHISAESHVLTLRLDLNSEGLAINAHGITDFVLIQISYNSVF